MPALLVYDVLQYKYDALAYDSVMALVQVRVSEERKARWSTEAQRLGLPLSKLVALRMGGSGSLTSEIERQVTSVVARRAREELRDQAEEVLSREVGGRLERLVAEEVERRVGDFDLAVITRHVIDMVRQDSVNFIREQIKSALGSSGASSPALFTVRAGKPSESDDDEGITREAAEEST